MNIAGDCAHLTDSMYSVRMHRITVTVRIIDKYAVQVYE